MARTLRYAGGGNYFWCPQGLLDLCLNPAAIAVYCLLAAYANKDDQCWPSYNTIASRLGISRRTAIRAIKQLHDLHLIEKTSIRHTKSQQRLNLYELVDIPSPSSPRGGGDMRAPTVVTPEHLPWCHQSTGNKEPLNKEPRNEERTPAPDRNDPLSERFVVGFRDLYGYTPRFTQEHRRKWRERLDDCPEAVLTAKIDAWWTYPLKREFRGNRTFGAFLQWFDDIPVNSTGPGGGGIVRTPEDWIEEMKSGSTAGRRHYSELIAGITDPDAKMRTLKQNGGVNDEDDVRTIIGVCDPTGQ